MGNLHVFSLRKGLHCVGCCAGKKLDQKVEQSIQASGVLLLTLVAVVLVVRDTINLGSGKPFM